jgi:hypothetical protein
MAATDRADGRWPLTLPRLFIILAVALPGIVAQAHQLPTNDFFWHLAMGREIVQRGGVPVTDSWSFTQSGEPFFNQPWLAQVIYYGLERLGGIPLILLVHGLLLAATFALLLVTCLRRVNDVRLCAAVLLLVVAPLTVTNWGVRPQAFAYPLFAAFLFVMTDYRVQAGGPSAARWHRLWTLPPLMVLWVNLHGSFMLGGLLVFVVFVVEALRRASGRTGALGWNRLARLLVIGMAVGVAMLLNPRGIAVLGYLRGLTGADTVRLLVTEWQSPTLADFSGVAFHLVLLALIALFAFTRLGLPDTVDGVLAGVFLLLAFAAVRNVVWFGIAIAPVLVGVLGKAMPRGAPEPGSVPANWIITAFLAALAIVTSGWVRPALPERFALLDRDTPVAAAEAFQAMHPRPQRLFHELGYGSYLIWAVPDQPVFVDGRMELYPLQQATDYIVVSNGYDVDRLLGKYRIDGTLLSKLQQGPLVAALRQHEGWQRVYEDDVAVLFLPAR